MKKYVFLEDGVEYYARSDDDFVRQLSFGHWFSMNHDPKDLDGYMYGFAQRVKNIANIDINWNSTKHFVESLISTGMISVETLVMN
jgi:hypothetical protein